MSIPYPFRIGIDARLYGVACGTGIGRYTEELIAALHTLTSHDVPALTFTVFLNRNGYRAFTPPDARWTKVLADYRPYSIAAQVWFPKVIRSAAVNLMHFTHFDHPLTYRAPFLVTIHDLILLNHPSVRATTLGPLRFWMKFAAYRHVIGHAIANSSRILTPSQTVKEQIVARWNVLPEKVIPTLLGSDHEQYFRHGSHLKSQIANLQSPYVLYIGNAYPHKNVEQLIRVMPELQRRIPNLKLVLVGRTDDFSKRLKRDVERRGSSGIVFFAQATDAERTHLLRSAAVYATASLDEGFALPPVEALAVGTPVVATDIPIHREILGTCATFFPKNDDAALVARIHSTIASPEHRAIVEGVERARQYSWRTCALQTLSAYREVAALIGNRHGSNETARNGETGTLTPPHNK